MPQPDAWQALNDFLGCAHPVVAQFPRINRSARRFGTGRSMQTAARGEGGDDDRGKKGVSAIGHSWLFRVSSLRNRELGPKFDERECSREGEFDPPQLGEAFLRDLRGNPRSRGERRALPAQPLLLAGELGADQDPVEREAIPREDRLDRGKRSRAERHDLPAEERALVGVVRCLERIA